MFKKVLIANRGEIAVRVLRTLRELKVKSVAVYSEADRSSLHVRLADEAVCIGPAMARESYLSIPAIISAARITGADAIHPGYGFLSENAEFSAACRDNGITFIGPSPKSIQQLGHKAEARKMAVKAGIAVTPGTKECVGKDFKKDAEKVGFPLMIKAAAGGGGKGIRIVREASQLANEMNMAQSESKAAFGNGDVYFEKYIELPRHIEVQFARDSHGNVIAFPERDCSIQRRHQKLVEESPSPAVNKKLREGLEDAAVKLANAANYVGVGTEEPTLLARCAGVGKLPKDVALRLSAVGPTLRASGVDYDIRKVDGYSIYPRFAFKVPLGTVGDVYDRYYLRILEMRESVKILQQALKEINMASPSISPKGQAMVKAPRTFRPPKGEAYGRIEAPKGELGFFIVADGTENPYRWHVRAPSLINLTVLREMLLGWKVADLMGIFGSIDIVMGEVDR